MATNPKLASERWEVAWRGFAPGTWQSRVNVREFIQRNYTPYEGDGAFLQGATERTKGMWKKLQPLLAKEREKGILDVSQVPSGILAHAPGYIDKDREIIVGLQTDAPLKRAIMPFGGWRVVAASLESYGYKPDPALGEIFTKYRKTHNDGVFDAYTPDIRKARSSGIVTGLPDAYGRGRIIGDYRRVALYGVDFLVADKEREKHELDDRHSTEDIIRLREELAEQIRSLKELKEMGSRYGYDISGPATNAREAVQWTYFGYLAAIKQQNGAAMSAGRLSTFWDIYFERDLREGKLTESQAQEIIDDLVIKWRIVRFLRAPEYNQLFSGDPVWVTEVVGGQGEDGRTLVTKSAFRMLHTLYNLGPAPEPNITVFWSPRLPDGFKRFAIKTSIDTSAIQYESDDLMRPKWGDDCAIACCVSAMRVGKQMQFFGARVNLRQDAALRPERRTRRNERRAGRAEARAGHRRPARLRRGDGPPRPDDGLAREDVRQRAQHHPLHARQVLLRGDRDGAARPRHPAHARLRHRRPLARGRQPVGDQVRQGEAGARRARDHRRLQDRGRVPVLRQQRRPRGRHRQAARVDDDEQDPQVPELPRRGPHPVGAHHHVQRGVRQGDGQHAGRPQEGRGLRARRESVERPRHARRPRGADVGRQDPVRRRRGRHLADAVGGARRARQRGGPHHARGQRRSTPISRAAASTSTSTCSTAKRCRTR